MMTLPYYSIPDAPNKINAPNIIARFVDSLGFRFKWATEGFTENEIRFKPCNSSMDMLELIKHIHYLAFFANRTFGGARKYKKSLENFTDIRNETLELYADLSKRLKKMEDKELLKFHFKPVNQEKEYPFWFLINGPIADALTHVGQISSWRRIAGNPQPDGVKVLFGKKV